MKNTAQNKEIRASTSAKNEYTQKPFLPRKVEFEKLFNPKWNYRISYFIHPNQSLIGELGIFRNV